MELTREKAIEEHRKMWRWVAEHPGKCKFDYLIIYHSHAVLLYNGFLCACAEAMRKKQGGMATCNYCPLDWGDQGCCGNDTRLLSRWNAAFFQKDWKLCTELARQIAELPERIVK